MMHWIFPEAAILPDLSVVDRTTARSCTISPMSSPQGEASEASGRITVRMITSGRAEVPARRQVHSAV